MIGDLNKIQIGHLLNTEFVARIGCHDGERSYVVPVSYVYHDGCLYGHSGLGLKVEMMRANPSVCVEIDHISDLANWQSVIAWGTYEELEGDEAETATALLVRRMTEVISDKGGRLPHPWNNHGGSVEHILHRASRHGVIFRIRISERTGRYETR
jgi:nitroimidazol reductase NimA-like FMN-containing flavoprotein (pyridoxamine 5'-phosphate oxidase superfamily)